MLKYEELKKRLQQNKKFHTHLYQNYVKMKDMPD